MFSLIKSRIYMYTMETVKNWDWTLNQIDIPFLSPTITKPDHKLVKIQKSGISLTCFVTICIGLIVVFVHWTLFQFVLSIFIFPWDSFCSAVHHSEPESKYKVTILTEDLLKNRVYTADSFPRHTYTKSFLNFISYFNEVIFSSHIYTINERARFSNDTNSEDIVKEWMW